MLCLILSSTYCAQNYAGIIGEFLDIVYCSCKNNLWLSILIKSTIMVKSILWTGLEFYKPIHLVTKCDINHNNIPYKTKVWREKSLAKMCKISIW